MLTHEQVIAYLEETLSPEEAAGFEAEIIANTTAANQLTELAQYDSALRTLVGGAEERTRIEQSVFAAIHGKSPVETQAFLSDQTLKQMPDQRSSNLGKHEGDNMNSPVNKRNVDNDLTKDQMAAEGVFTDLSGTDRIRSKQYQEDLAEEAKWDEKKGANPKPAPAPESETKGEDNDYYNGLSQ